MKFTGKSKRNSKRVDRSMEMRTGGVVSCDSVIVTGEAFGFILLSFQWL
jgi:hypothetical protein